MFQTKHEVHFTGQNTKKKIKTGTAKDKRSPARVLHMAKLLALAIRLVQLIRDGVVADQGELARLGHVSPARLTPMMNLLQLAPDVKEDLLFLPPTKSGYDVISERQVRPILVEVSWGGAAADVARGSPMATESASSGDST